MEFASFFTRSGQWHWKCTSSTLSFHLVPRVWHDALQDCTQHFALQVGYELNHPDVTYFLVSSAYALGNFKVSAISNFLTTLCVQKFENVLTIVLVTKQYTIYLWRTELWVKGLIRILPTLWHTSEFKICRKTPGMSTTECIMTTGKQALNVVAVCSCSRTSPIDTRGIWR